MRREPARHELWGVGPVLNPTFAPSSSNALIPVRTRREELSGKGSLA